MSKLFIVLLSFSSSIATKFLFLSYEACMVRPTFIENSLDKCSESCNVLSPKMCFSKEAKVVNKEIVKAFNIITNKNETKGMTKNISCDYECNFNSTTCNSNQKWNNKTINANVKIIVHQKKDFSWNPSPCICEKSKYLKSIADRLKSFDLQIWGLFRARSSLTFRQLQTVNSP